MMKTLAMESFIDYGKLQSIVCTKQDIIDKIYSNCKIFDSEKSIDPVWIQAIVEKESDYRFWAFRFEPGFYYTYIHRKFSYGDIKREVGKDVLKDVSKDTEEFSRACSWGVMQVLGQVMRERRYMGILHHILFLPDIGIEYGIKQFLRQWKRYNGDLEKTIHAYNAGTARGESGTFPYVVDVMQKIRRIEKYGRHYNCY